MVSGVTPIGQSVTIRDNCVTHHIPYIQFEYIGKLNHHIVHFETENI